MQNQPSFYGGMVCLSAITEYMKLKYNTPQTELGPVSLSYVIADSDILGSSLEDFETGDMWNW